MANANESLQSLQTTTSSTMQQSSQNKLTLKQQRKQERRRIRRAQRIVDNPGLAETAKFIFLQYDEDENGHMDANEVLAMLLDLQRSVVDHRQVCRSTAERSAAQLCKALDSDGNNEIELEELQDWIIRMANKLDAPTRSKIMAMHDGGDDSMTVESQVVLIRIMTAVEEIRDFIEQGCVVAVFGAGRLGVSLTDSGALAETFVRPTPGEKNRAACIASSDIMIGMEIVRVGHRAVDKVSDIIELLKSVKRPVQIIFQPPSQLKHDAATKLQRIQSSRNTISEAEQKVQKMRVYQAAKKLFLKYDQDLNDSLDAEELKHFLSDIIISWTGVGTGDTDYEREEGSSGLNDDDDEDEETSTEEDITKELKLAYQGAQMLVKVYGSTHNKKKEKEIFTRCEINDGPLGIKIDMVPIENADGVGNGGMEVVVLEISEGSQLAEQKVRPGNIIVEIAGTNIQNKKYDDILTMIKTTPRPFNMKLLKHHSENPTLSMDQFSQWVWRTSEKWKNPTETMNKARFQNHTGTFLIEVATSIANTAQISKGGAKIVAYFRTPIGMDLGMELSPDGRVTRSEGEALELGVEVGMLVLQVGQKDFTNLNVVDIGNYFLKLIQTSRRPMSVILRRSTSEEREAAKKMQAMHRGRSVRKVQQQEQQEQQEKGEAAKKMQAMHRGRSVRKVQQQEQQEEQIRKLQQQEEQHEYTMEKMVEAIIVHAEGKSRRSTGTDAAASQRLNPRYQRTVDDRLDMLTVAAGRWFEWSLDEGTKRGRRRGGPPLIGWSSSLVQVTPNWGNGSGDELRKQLSSLMSSGDAQYKLVMKKVLFAQRWIRRMLTRRRFLRVVEEAAVIKIQRIRVRYKNKREGQRMLEAKRVQRETEREVEEIRKAADESRKRNESREKSRKQREKEYQRLDQKKKEREGRRRGRRRREEEERRRHGGGQGDGQGDGQGGGQGGGRLPNVLPNVLPHIPAPIIPRQLTPNTPNHPQRVDKNSLLAEIQPAPRRSLVSLFESNLFLNIETNDLLPLLRIAPAHQQAVIRYVMQRASNGDTSSLEDLIVDGCEEATTTPTFNKNNSYDGWGTGQSYDMTTWQQQQWQQQQWQQQQWQQQQQQLMTAGGPPMYPMMMAPSSSGMMSGMVGRGMSTDGYGSGGGGQGGGQQNTPKMKHLRPGKDLLNKMDPSKFSGVVVFDKGKPVEAHVDEPGQRPIWDEMWSNFNSKHGV